MSNSTDVYITNFSLSQISKKLGLKGYSELVYQLSEVNFDLKEYFSDPELISMNRVNLLFKSFLDSKVRTEIETINRFQKNYKERKIYVTKPPSFTTRFTCLRLSLTVDT